MCKSWLAHVTLHTPSDLKEGLVVISRNMKLFLSMMLILTLTLLQHPIQKEFAKSKLFKSF